MILGDKQKMDIKIKAKPSRYCSLNTMAGFTSFTLKPVILLSGLFFAGCTSTSVPPIPEVPVVEISGEPFAVEISQLSIGEQRIMDTPFGPDALVIVEDAYTSGLGTPCRKVWVKSGASLQLIAVCKDESDWHMVEPIFERSQR